MAQIEIGKDRWSFIQARRDDDLAFGVVKQENRPGIVAALLAEEGWRQIYSERKIYDHTGKEVNVRVWFNADETLVLKLDDSGMLVDQAAALIRLKQAFGIKVPDDLLIVTDGAVSLLQMEKLDFRSGYAVDKIVKGDYPIPEGSTCTKDDYKSLYEQANKVAKLGRAFIQARPFDETGFHHGNWGVTTSAFDNWAPGKTLEAKDVVIFDPVTMHYEKPKKKK